MSSRYLLPLAVAAALAAPVAAHAEQGDWLVRVGLSQVNPEKESLEIPGTAFLVVDSDVSPTFNVSYFLTKHISTELLAAWPFTHGVDIRPFEGGKSRVGYVDQLPPTLSLNWHFNQDGTIRPYIGAGINYTLFSGEETAGPLGGNDLKLDDSFGAAGQVGIDMGKGNWFVNVNARYIQIESDTTLNGVDIGTLEINPWVYGLHVGYKFGSPAPTPVAAPEPAPAAAPPPPPPPPPAPAPADSDGDGVADDLDKCPGTPAGTKVDKVGCPLEQTLKLLFDFDSAELRPESITELERVVKFMNDVPFAATLIQGHTDSVGNDAYNLKLSDRRAKAVFDYLSSRGVDPARVKSEGKGEAEPIADNKTAEGRQENRRVMLIRTDSGM
ncbi:MAG TPA: OmpW family outer membrane protein [Steroidobacteraceae bacterium]|nr:OmpW family outer membrane protein [Steroidobacteraceae bacterium]